MLSLVHLIYMVGDKLHASECLLPYISFIVAFIASECIKRYWESICGESK